VALCFLFALWVAPYLLCPLFAYSICLLVLSPCSLPCSLHYHNRGGGHLYQGRFKSFPIADDEHFYVVCRYVESNAMRAGLVNSAKDWSSGSLHRWNLAKDSDPPVLSPWPIRRLPRWNERVDAALTAGELKELRTCVDRSRPFGSEQWIEQVAERHGLWHTLRPAGGPRKRPKLKVVSE
jgi:putative transposase